MNLWVLLVLAWMLCFQYVDLCNQTCICRYVLYACAYISAFVSLPHSVLLLPGPGVKELLWCERMSMSGSFLMSKYCYLVHSWNMITFSPATKNEVKSLSRKLFFFALPILIFTMPGPSTPIFTAAEVQYAFFVLIFTEKVFQVCVPGETDQGDKSNVSLEKSQAVQVSGTRLGGSKDAGWSHSGASLIMSERQNGAFPGDLMSWVRLG